MTRHLGIAFCTSTAYIPRFNQLPVGEDAVCITRQRVAVQIGGDHRHLDDRRTRALIPNDPCGKHWLGD
jgi:hypothetical protein